VIEFDDGVVRPEPAADFIPRHHLTGPIQQHAENLERLVLQRNLSVAASQLPRTRVEFEAAKSDNVGNLLILHLRNPGGLLIIRNTVSSSIHGGTAHPQNHSQIMFKSPSAHGIPDAHSTQWRNGNKEAFMILRRKFVLALALVLSTAAAKAKRLSSKARIRNRSTRFTTWVNLNGSAGVFGREPSVPWGQHPSRWSGLQTMCIPFTIPS